MGYYKNTTYYGPNSMDFSDTSPEPRAERRRPAASRPYVGRWPDATTCLVCEAQAPQGQAWVEGICIACRELTR
jgi:hypothetical protein